MTDSVFQPFTDRLSRDIRNGLSSSLVTALEESSMLPAQRFAGTYLARNLDNVYHDYIRQRLEGYRRVLSVIEQGDGDPLFNGLVLWDEKLFFEVHEVLEHAWRKSTGEEKLLLQAMIRAAGVYIKLEAGYPTPAAKIAAKAIPVLQKYHHRLASYTEPERLTLALQRLTIPAPKLLQE